MVKFKGCSLKLRFNVNVKGDCLNLTLHYKVYC
jgi:hypothetical protein